MSVTAAWALLSSLQARITRAPLLARSSAVALPIPVFAPGSKPAQMSIISVQLVSRTPVCGVWTVSALAELSLLRCVTRLKYFYGKPKFTESVLNRLMIKMKTCNCLRTINKCTKTETRTSHDHRLPVQFGCTFTFRQLQHRHAQQQVKPHESSANKQKGKHIQKNRAITALNAC